MSSFRDNTGREWIMDINAAAVKRVREWLGIDLASASRSSVLDKLSADPELLVNVIYVLCQPQAEQCGVSDEDFGRSLAGDAIAAATDALLAELVQFAPTKYQPALHRWLEQSRGAANPGK